MQISLNTPVVKYKSDNVATSPVSEEKKRVQSLSLTDLSGVVALNQQAVASGTIENVALNQPNIKSVLSSTQSTVIEQRLNSEEKLGEFTVSAGLVDQAAKTSGEQLSDMLNQQNGSDASQQQNAPQGKVTFSSLISKEVVAMQNAVTSSELESENTLQRQSAHLATLSANFAEQQGAKGIAAAKDSMTGVLSSAAFSVTSEGLQTRGAIKNANKTIASSETNLRTNVVSRHNIAESENEQTVSQHSLLSEGESANHIYEASLKQPKAAQEADNQHRQIDHDNVMKAVNKSHAKHSLVSGVLNKTGEVTKAEAEVSAATNRSDAIQDGVAKETLNSLSANQKKRADKAAETRENILKALNDAIATEQNLQAFVAEKRA
ncbi:hypothetical protein [Hafnia paralvei]|uniref:hypothetical protein n=1 Tax=Hafnia paralvei TaxID=546367 RepID=UPI00300CFD6D